MSRNRGTARSQEEEVVLLVERRGLYIVFTPGGRPLKV